MIGSNGSSEDTGYVLGSEEVHDLFMLSVRKGESWGQGGSKYLRRGKGKEGRQLGQRFS